MNTITGMAAGTKAASIQFLNLAADGVQVLAEHESHSAGKLWQALKARAAVAQKARGLGELLRDQLDLMPDSLAQLSSDHQLRLALLDGLRRDLASVTTAKRAS